MLALVTYLTLPSGFARLAIPEINYAVYMSVVVSPTQEDDMRNASKKGIVRYSSLAILLLTMVASAYGAEAGNCGFDEGDPDAGKRIYQYSCISCHGSNGKGAIPGAPDFNQKGGVLSKPHSALTDHIVNGFRSPGSRMAMPPMGGNPNLTEKDMLDVHAYLHQRFGCG